MALRHSGTPAWQALWSAIEAPLMQGLTALGLNPDLDVGPLTWAPGQLPLDASLLGPAPWVGADAALRDEPWGALALDRWRRATGLLLEGALLHEQAGKLGRPVADVQADPRQRGAAADRLDRSLPELGWLWAEAVALARAPHVSMVDEPRRGAWLLRYEASHGPVQTATDWARFGAWCRDRRLGPLATLPVAVDACHPSPWAEGLLAPALSHLVVQVAPGAAGWMLADGAAASWPARVAGEPAVVVIGGLSAVDALVGAPLGPVGTWRLRSGAAMGHVGAARGVELSLLQSGRAELVAADAFVGPPTRGALEMAEQLGVSGMSTGRWRVLSAEGADRGTLQVTGLSADRATVHAHSGKRFALPAAEWLDPVRRALADLDGQAAAWQRTDDGDLELRARLFGVETLLRFGPA
jgi:hypothetical protein